MKKRKAYLTALAVAVGLYVLVISPLENARERIGTELPQKQASLVKHRKFIAKYTTEKERMETHRQELTALERFTISESDPSLAAASVQSKVQDIAASAGIKVNSVRALSPVRKELYTTLPVYMDGRGDITEVSRMLNLVDNSKEMLAVEKIEISSTRTSGKLRIKVQIAGLMKND